MDWSMQLQDMIYSFLHEGLAIGRETAMEIKVITSDRNYMTSGLSMVERLEQCKKYCRCKMVRECCRSKLRIYGGAIKVVHILINMGIYEDDIVVRDYYIH